MDQKSLPEADERTKMGYDGVILRIGNFGRFQMRIFLVLILPAIACSFQKMGGVFLTAKADFRCLLPHENPENSTYLQSPTNFTTATTRCEKYRPDYADPYDTSQGSISLGNHTAVKCDSFVYDDTYYTETVTTEWDLVCDNAWLKTLSDSMFMLGDLPGVVISGGLADKFGRRSALLWVSILQIVFATLVAVSPNVYVYMISRALVGLTTSGLFTIAYVTVVEMATPDRRMKVGISMNIAYTSGYILSCGLAYVIRTWRILQIAFIIPTSGLLVLWWSLPESARWLLNKGRVEEAKDILQKASSENGTRLSRNTLDRLLSNESAGAVGKTIERSSILDLLKYPNLRKKSLVLFFVWFVSSITYYGLSLNTSNLGGNDYLNFVYAGAVEIPANVSLILTLDRWGRKLIMCGGMLLAGISLLVTYFVPADMSWMVKVLAMIGKLAITSAWTTAYIFTAEQYPTVIRTVGVGACSSIARIAGAVAPYTKYLFEISTYLPFTVLGISSMIAGLMSLLLPETLNKKLPESIQDGEEFGKIATDNKSKRRNREEMLRIDVDAAKPLREEEKMDACETLNGFN